MYSTLTTAYDQYLVENNWVTPTYTATSADALKIYKDFVEPYMQVSVNAGTDPDEKKKIMHCNSYKRLDSTVGSSYCSKEIRCYYAVQLKDGSVLWFVGKNKEIADVPTFRYDVNGKKGPNMVGKDMFIFSMTDKGITPGKSNTYQTPQEIASDCNPITGLGSGCATYIIVHGNMNYLK